MLDTLQLMPDHLHAILRFEGDTLSLSDVIHHLKSRTTAQYALGVREFGWPSFHGRLWQRGFYDRIIRRDDELARTREYIVENPVRWSLRRLQIGDQIGE